MAEALKILMMGGQRTGKSSLLAGLVDQLMHGPISKMLTLSDKKPEDTRRLERKIAELKYVITHYQGRTILVDEGKTATLDDYVIELKIPNSKETMEIVFTDANGEFYESGMQGNEEINRKMESYDVFLIAIDTPYLMESANKQNKLCTDSVNEGYNFVNDMHNFLTRINDGQGKNAHQVIFVPLKCEYWAKRGELEKVYQRVLEVYKTALTGLSGYLNVEVDVIPIQTAGGLIFKEHREPYLLLSKGRRPQRCAYNEEDDTIRLADGTIRELRDGETIDDDPTAVISKTYQKLRPLSWFMVSGPYESHNCEQVLLYVLRFLVAKVLAAKKAQNENKRKGSGWRYLAYAAAAYLVPVVGIGLMAYELYSQRLGTMDLNHLNNLLTTLKNKNFIKENVEGIHIVQPSALSYV